MAPFNRSRGNSDEESRADEQWPEARTYMYGNMIIQRDADGGFVQQSFAEDAYYHPNDVNSNVPQRIRGFRIEYIERASKRNVTFKKRIRGLMNKAEELEILTGSTVFCAVLNEAGELTTYCSKSIEVFGDYWGECLKDMHPINNRDTQRRKR